MSVLDEAGKGRNTIWYMKSPLRLCSRRHWWNGRAVSLSLTALPRYLQDFNFAGMFFCFLIITDSDS